MERLLESPAYGERWGRHWLDVARWAESEGYESNHLRPYSWRYRDYVVRSFNEDKPFALFVCQQVAGDEMTPYEDDNLIATGFLAAGRLSSNEEDKVRQRNDVLVDVTNATASAFLGVTLHCAQCHRHKFDAFSARDYYRFQGFFVKGQLALLVLRDPALTAAYEKARPPEYEPLMKEQQTLYEAGRAGLCGRAAEADAGDAALLDIPSERRSAAEERLAREADLKFRLTPDAIEKRIPPEFRKLLRRAETQAGRHATSDAGSAADLWLLFAGDQSDAGRDAADEGLLSAALRTEGTGPDPAVLAGRRRRPPSRAGRGRGLAGGLRCRPAGGHGQAAAVGPGRLAEQSAQPADRPRLGQSAVALPLRPRPRGHAGRLRRQGSAAVAPRVARLAGVGVRAFGRVHQAPAPADRRLGHLPPGSAAASRQREDRPGQRAAVALAAAAAGGGGDPRQSAGRERRTESQRRRSQRDRREEEFHRSLYLLQKREQPPAVQAPFRWALGDDGKLSETARVHSAAPGACTCSTMSSR